MSVTARLPTAIRTLEGMLVSFTPRCQNDVNSIGWFSLNWQYFKPFQTSSQAFRLSQELGEKMTIQHGMMQDCLAKLQDWALQKTLAVQPLTCHVGEILMNIDEY